MASEEMGLVSARRVENGLNPQLVFHESSFSCGAPPPPQPPGRVGSVTGDPGPKTTRELTGFIDKYDNHQHHYFINQHQPQAADFRRQMFGDDRGDGDGSEDDDMDEDEDDEDNDDENEVEGIVTVENSNHHQNNSSDKVNSNSSSKVVGSDKTKSVSTFGKFLTILLFFLFWNWDTVFD